MSEEHQNSQYTNESEMSSASKATPDQPAKGDKPIGMTTDGIRGPVHNSKIFVGGLSLTLTQEELKTFFTQFGEIEDIQLIHDHTGASRGFGFVTFKDPTVAKRIVDDKSLKLEERALECKFAVHKAGTSRPDDSEAKKIFVNGLPDDITGDEFKTYFSKFGSVFSAILMTDHNTGKPRGFGFITFDDETSVDLATKIEGGGEIRGKKLEIRKALPKRPRFSTAPRRSYWDEQGPHRAAGGWGAMQRHHPYAPPPAYPPVARGGGGWDPYSPAAAGGYGGGAYGGYGAAAAGGYGAGGYGASAYGAGAAAYGAGAYGASAASYRGAGDDDRKSDRRPEKRPSYSSASSSDRAAASSYYSAHPSSSSSAAAAAAAAPSSSSASSGSAYDYAYYGGYGAAPAAGGAAGAADSSAGSSAGYSAEYMAYYASQGYPSGYYPESSPSSSAASSSASSASYSAPRY